jgi:RHS repeat-associated protein
VDGVTYTWDDRGNLTNDGTFTYTYNAAGRLVQAESITSTLVYTYTATGLRVGQRIDGDVTEFAWDWASGLPEMLAQSTSSQSTLYLVGHETLGQWDGASPGGAGEWAYYLPDALGSVRQVTDETGAVVSAREWTPYGVKVGGAQAGLGYTGEWQDPALGLQYLRARWYDSYLNQFVSPDPIVPDYRNPQSINGYTYALGNPVGYVDPSGEKPYCPEDPCIDPPKTCVKTFRFVVLPILREIRPTQWFGDTVFASNNRGLYNYLDCCVLTFLARRDTLAVSYRLRAKG